MRRSPATATRSKIERGDGQGGDNDGNELRERDNEVSDEAHYSVTSSKTISRREKDVQQAARGIRA